MLGKKAKINYRRVKTLSRDFDRNFDNTVVDTYAFDKVLHSEQFSLFLYDQLVQCDNQFSLTLSDIIQKTGTFIVQEVEKIYSKTQHRVVNLNVYYAYVNQLVTRIVNTESSLHKDTDSNLFR
ncbi:MAG TPA: hypothetical protein PK466_06590 [Thermotogota bacterium]|nr:hypothetical protein [Thermotogota bacterium]HPJ90038.1 hypothetical protein [Thermotogota bacterium]HPR95979.1 hypothetical protein [Thermotogota bacterium]